MSSESEEQLDTSVLTRVVGRAFSIARACKHLEVTDAHLLRALLDEAEVVEAVEGCGADVEVIRDMADGTLDELRRRPWYRRRPVFDPSLDDILLRAVVHASSAELDRVRAVNLLVHLAAAERHSVVFDRLDALGVGAMGLKTWSAHGGAAPPLPELPPNARCDVLLHDDPFTTMEFVVEVLRDLFDHSEEDASRIMLAVHRDGVGVAGSYPFTVAREKVERLTERALARDFPLRATLRRERSG